MLASLAAPRGGASTASGGRAPLTTVDVAIHGRGAVASSLALALNRQGLRVALSSPAPSTSRVDVRAYALNLASRRLLQQLKIWQALPADAVTAVHDMNVRGDRAGAQLGFSSWTQCVDALAWIVDAPALDQALHQALQFAPHVQRLDVLPPAALNVYAEGKDSESRASLPLRWERHAYGHSAIAARLQSADAHGNVAHQWFRAPDVLALLPFDRPRAGHGYGLVWSLPDARAEALLALPPADFEQALAEATRGAAGPLRLSGERAAWPLALAHAERVAGAGWVLVGDAAHVVHPLAGQGLNLGLADVRALAAVLAAREPWRPLGDERLLARYARERAAPTRAMGHVTDALLHLFATEQPIWKELRNRGLTLVNHLPPLKRFLTARALDA
jgi:2-polyprenyl-6-methoxyphenol hydroxylase-like FAD-dependent oxidoreductase